MASTAAIYRNSDASANSKTGEAEVVSSRVLYFRRRVARSMVLVHAISPELADYHASEMSEDELLRRMRQYAEECRRSKEKSV